MKSPFPGMDPFLERHWQDVHSRFMVYASRQLNSQLPDDLIARVEESLAVESDDSPRRVIYPDISVAQQEIRRAGYESEPIGVAVVDPFEVLLSDSIPPLRHLEIVDAGSGNRIVTVIELLSPVNKSTSVGRASYLKKQSEYIRSAVNLVEIDLLRCGEFVLAMHEESWPTRYLAPYKICIRRSRKPSIAEGIGIKLQDKLPNIAIPLRPIDRDAILQIQPIMDDCYRDGKYHLIDYSKPLQPSLNSVDAAWVDNLLKQWRESHASHAL